MKLIELFCLAPNPRPRFPVMSWALLFVLVHAFFLTSSSHAISASGLRSGDVILLSLPCHICKIIEAEEGAPYSHLGIVLVREDRPISVLDAYHEVREVPLPEFIKLRDPKTLPVVLRAKNWNAPYSSGLSEGMRSRFDTWFRGLRYDSAFLWDNQDERGEKLYCSEFAAKFLNSYLPSPIEPKPMHFLVSRDDWIRFFKGTPPDGKPGVSPADFFRSPLFQNLGALEPESTD